MAFSWRALGLRWVGLALLWLAYRVTSFGLLVLTPADAIGTVFR